MPEFTIDFDGLNQTISCAAGDTILRAALRAGLGFPYECNSGGCGSCKFELVEGTVDTLWDDAPGLSPRDHARGRHLACQCTPLSPVKLKVRLKPAIATLRPRRRAVVLTAQYALTTDMRELCFKDIAPAEFCPGQFALLELPEVRGSRAYSMSNLPNPDGEWRFIIKRVPNGHGSGYLFEQLKTGDQIELDGPYGLAFLRPEVKRDIVCIGGGSGLSPMMSIAAAAVRESALRDQQVLLFYGGRRPQDICTPPLIARDAVLSARVTCFNAISDRASADGWAGECCLIHELVAKTLGANMQRHEFYFCGPPPMTDAVARMLVVEHHVPQDQLHYDRFY